MKNSGRQALALLLAIALFLVAVPVQVRAVESKDKELRYTDVGKGHWAYDDIWRATNLGLFSGYTMGDGSVQFRPSNVMTRGHFVTVIARALFSDELEKMPQGERYFTNPYTLLVKNGILKDGELNYTELDEPCKRQEMALLLCRADMFMWPFSSLEESDFPSDELEPDEVIDEIPDLFTTVDEHYRNYILFAYTAGYLKGVDSTRAIHGQDSMSRAQGAAVLIRLIDEIKSWEYTTAGIDSADKDGGTPDEPDEVGMVINWVEWTSVIRTMIRVKDFVKDDVSNVNKVDRRTFLREKGKGQ